MLGNALYKYSVLLFANSACFKTVKKLYLKLNSISVYRESFYNILKDLRQFHDPTEPLICNEEKEVCDPSMCGLGLYFRKRAGAVDSGTSWACLPSSRLSLQ